MKKILLLICTCALATSPLYSGVAIGTNVDRMTPINDRANLADTPPTPATERYYVKLVRPNAKQAVDMRTYAEESAIEVAAVYDIEPIHIFHQVAPAFSLDMEASIAKQLAADPRVESVSLVGYLSFDTQYNAPWGLDRIDQLSLPLNGIYTLDAASSSNVHAYVFDTGIDAAHPDFSGRVAEEKEFWSYIPGGAESPTPGDGESWPQGSNEPHGTAVSSVLLGAKHGVAKQIKLHSVRVSNNKGSIRRDDLLRGLEWLSANLQTPAVINMSFGGESTGSVIEGDLRSAIVSMIQTKRVSVVVAAGNDAVDACTQFPANIPEAVTVGATNRYDALAEFSNWGSCVDILAPGEDVLVADAFNFSTSKTGSGTSYAAPYVAGVVALYLSRNPTLTPSQIATSLQQNIGSNGVVSAFILAPLLPPTSVVASAQGCYGYNTVSWAAVPGASRYELWQSYYQSFSSPTFVQSVDGTSTADPYFPPYRYLKVRACDARGCGDFNRWAVRSAYYSGCGE